MCSHAATLALVESVSSRLQSRYQLLDTVGLGSSPHRLNRLSQDYSSNGSNNNANRITFINTVPLSQSVFVPQNATKIESNTGPTSVTSRKSEVKSDALPRKSTVTAAESLETRGISKSQQPPPPSSSSRVDLATEEQHHQSLVSQVMRDFGFNFEQGKKTLQQRFHMGRDERDDEASNDAAAVATSNVGAQTDVTIKDGLQDITAISGGALSEGHNATAMMNSVFTREDDEEEEQPRPRTPPHPREAAAHHKQFHHDPNVLVVAGFEEPSQSASLKEKKPTNRSASRERLSRANPTGSYLEDGDATRDIAAPTFSAAAIADLLSLSRIALTSAKRDELFAVAQRAFEGIVNSKEAVGQAYRTYPNVCRSSEKSASRSLRSVNDVFSAVVAHTTLHHQRGSLVADQRAVHRKLIVPGGCSTMAAEVVSKRLGRLGEVLRVVPRGEGSAAVSHQTSSDAVGGAPNDSRVNNVSPNRWPHRVISVPFVAANLSAQHKKVRHNSAPRKTSTVHATASTVPFSSLASRVNTTPRRARSASQR